MPDLRVQQVCVKFCFLLGKTAVEPFTVLKEAFKEETVVKTQVYQWFSVVCCQVEVSATI